MHTIFTEKAAKMTKNRHDYVTKSGNLWAFNQSDDNFGPWAQSSDFLFAWKSIALTVGYIYYTMTLTLSWGNGYVCPKNEIKSQNWA